MLFFRVLFLQRNRHGTFEHRLLLSLLQLASVCKLLLLLLSPLPLVLLLLPLPRFKQLLKPALRCNDAAEGPAVVSL